MQDWRSIVTAPDGRNIEVAVIDRAGTHALATPCCQRDAVWISAETGHILTIHPTHWREPSK
jgi:hypothetical protein